MLAFNEEFVIFVSFVVFVGLVFRPVKKMINDAIDAKITDTRNALDEATHLRAEAEIYLEEAAQALKDAKSTADEVMQNAQKRSAALLEALSGEIEAIKQRKEQNMKSRLRQQEMSIVGEAKRAAVAEVMEDLERYFDSELSQEQKERMFDSAFSSSRRFIN
jgi:F-type H+-transporting ATPase subunit b